MNYRHIYHAGNAADVFKHALLLMLLERMREKEKPFLVVDTHAGIGLYDLHSVEAQKTFEYKLGIERVLGAQALTPLLAQYASLVRQHNNEGELRYYPGSPLFSYHMLRANDRMVLSELHPEDFETLSKHCNLERVELRHMDAYTAVKAVLPPKETRALVLMDPPFERRDEFEALTKALQDAVKRFAVGVYALWYPVKPSAPVARFYRMLEATGIKKILMVELNFGTEASGAENEHSKVGGLTGTGLAIINPPWKLDEAVQVELPEIARVLGLAHATCRTWWLAGE